MARSRTFADGKILTPADVNDHLVNHVPNPGDAFDTGWVNVPTRAGFAGQAGTLPQVRRVGLVVYWRWGFASTGLTPSVASTVADVPEGYRPTQNVYVVPTVQRPDLPAARLVFNVSGEVSVLPGPDLAAYYIGNFSWPVG